jgi:hypothetical protein
MTRALSAAKDGSIQGTDVETLENARRELSMIRSRMNRSGA